MTMTCVCAWLSQSPRSPWITSLCHLWRQPPFLMLWSTDNGLCQCMFARGTWRDGVMIHFLEVALSVIEEFPLDVPCALFLLTISCTVFLTALPTRQLWYVCGFPSYLKSSLLTLRSKLSVEVEAPSTYMSGTLMSSPIVSWLCSVTFGSRELRVIFFLWLDLSVWTRLWLMGSWRTCLSHWLIWLTYGLCPLFSIHYIEIWRRIEFRRWVI